MQVRLVALVPVLGLALAGCSGGKAQPSPLAPVTASPSASPTATVVEVPAEARAATPQGAAAFARYYLKVLSEASESGDVMLLSKLSRADCNVCRELRQIIVDEIAKGERVKDAGYLVSSAEATSDRPGDAIVDVIYDVPEFATTDAAGRVIRTTPAQRRQLMQIRTLHERGEWRAYGIQFLGDAP